MPQDSMKTILPPERVKTFDLLVSNCLKEAEEKGIKFLTKDTTKQLEDTTREVLALPDKQKVQLILYIVNRMHEWFKGKKSWGTSDPGFANTYVYRQYFDYLFKIKVVLDEEDVANITNSFVTRRISEYTDITAWPIKSFLTKIERSFKIKKLPSQVIKNIEQLRSEVDKVKSTSKSAAKILIKIDSMLAMSSEGGAR